MVSLSQCPGCNGTALIQVQNGGAKVSARYQTLDDDEGAFGNYPCPVCQPVFYYYDLQQVSAAEKIPAPLSRDANYIIHAFRRIAQKLGVLVVDEFVEKDRREDIYDPKGSTELHGRMFVVKSNAKGWENLRNRV